MPVNDIPIKGEKHTTARARLKGLYGRNTIALPHETLTQSPLQNVLQPGTLLPASAIPSFGKSFPRMNCLEPILKPNARLCPLVADGATGQGDKPWNDVLEEYRSVWEQAGTKGDKAAGTEHPALLPDALTLTEKPAAKALKNGLEWVKKGLERTV